MSQPAAISIVQTIRSIPPLPAAVQRLCVLADSPDADLREIARVISIDPALMGRILRIANSAFYGLSQRIGTASRACAVLGIHGVRNTALASSIFCFSRQLKQFSMLDELGLWHHSLAVATAARRMAILLNLKDREEAFASGLIHNIGRMVLVEHFQWKYKAAMERSRHDGIPLYTAETEIFGVNDAGTGYALCEYWKMPPAICEAVGHHHDDIDPGEIQNPLIYIVQAADILAALAGLSGGENLEADLRVPDWLGQTGVSPEQIEEIVRTLPEEVARSQSLFKERK